MGSCLDRGGSWDYQFAECDTARSHPGPTSACLRDLPGSWVVAGHVAPGISAMSDAEADSWIGSRLSLSRDAVTFRDHVCVSPVFTTEETPRQELEGSTKGAAEALGLRGAVICETEIACAGPSPNPGDLLIHGTDELLTLWDGVFFRLRRE